MAQDKVTLMFDGVAKVCSLQEDRNGEFLFVAEDGSFVKFPADCNIEDEINAYNEVNSKKVELNLPVQYGEVITFSE